MCSDLYIGHIVYTISMEKQKRTTETHEHEKLPVFIKSFPKKPDFLSVSQNMRVKEGKSALNSDLPENENIDLYIVLMTDT